MAYVTLEDKWGHRPPLQTLLKHTALYVFTYSIISFVLTSHFLFKLDYFRIIKLKYIINYIQTWDEHNLFDKLVFFLWPLVGIISIILTVIS